MFRHACVQMLRVEGMEAFAEERDREVRAILQSINDLGQIMKDLSTLVIDQGTILDRIDANMDQVCCPRRLATAVLEAILDLTSLWQLGSRQAARDAAACRMISLHHNLLLATAQQGFCHLLHASIGDYSAMRPDRAKLLVAQRAEAAALSTPTHVQVATHIEEGVKQLVRAEKHQKNSRMILCIMLLVAAVIFMLIILVAKNLLF